LPACTSVGFEGGGAHRFERRSLRGESGPQHQALEHAADLEAHALAAIEIEHLGALEWDEVSPGIMGLTSPRRTI
jgi:hypothetical protein